MTIADVHALLIDRFTTDAETLRARAAGTGLAGPNAARSREMAEACEAIVQALRTAAATPEALTESARRFETQAAAAPVAAQPVWRGAATRVRELLALVTA